MLTALLCLAALVGCVRIGVWLVRDAQRQAKAADQATPARSSEPLVAAHLQLSWSTLDDIQLQRYARRFRVQ